MSTQTPNLNLDLREASDIFNPLSTNSNFETLDSVITEIRKKGGVPTYTTTASANLLKLSENPVPNETLFKFVAAGDANTWSYQEAVNNIVALDGNPKTVKGGEMYVAWVNAANAMIVIAWPDVVDAQTFDGKGPAEWASKAQLDAVNQTAANATQTAQAAATVANQALEKTSNIKGTWAPITFTTTMEDDNSKVFFNESLGLVYIKLSMRVLNAPGSPTLMTFPNNEFTLKTGSFSVLGISKSANEPVSAYILTKYGSDLVIDSHPADVGWNITNPYIYATVVLGAIKN